MNAQDVINYERITQAIAYITEHFLEQPDLDTVAAEVHLSPYHFQKLFQEWAGVSPKKFVQYLSVSYARELIRSKPVSLFETAMETGLSSASRLHELFITFEAMSPDEFRQRGAGLEISYAFSDTVFGRTLIASTSRGICFLSFEDHEGEALKDLSTRFPESKLSPAALSPMQQNALRRIQYPNDRSGELHFHLKGTPFQVKVWEALLSIAPGRLSTYGNLAAQTGNTGASRAVGTAIGANPVALLIPCHRVIQSNGLYGQYRWGSIRKKALIGWEAAGLELAGRGIGNNNPELPIFE